jgi:hypothetical protein
LLQLPVGSRDQVAARPAVAGILSELPGMGGSRAARFLQVPQFLRDSGILVRLPQR